MKSDITYSNDMLLVNVEGNMLENDYERLKRKIGYIVSEYEINDVIFNIKSMNIKQEYLEDLNKTFSNITIKR